MSIRVLSGPLHDRMPPAPNTPIHVVLVDLDTWPGYTFILTYQRGEFVGLEIKRGADAQPLSRVALQQVPLGALDRAARKQITSFLGSWEDHDRPWVAELRIHFPEIEDWWDATADQGAASKDDVRLALLAKRYVELDGQAGWRRTLAKELGWSEKSIQTMVSRARKRRLLSQVAPGQRGGYITPRARILLGETTREEIEKALEWFLAEGDDAEET